MNCIEGLGVTVILRLQALGGPTADALFKLVAFLGDEKFYLLLLPLVYWCIDKRLGIRLAVLVMASNTVNLWLKFACGLPRPSAPPVRQVAIETGPGFPSGHTQSVTVTAGYLVREIRRWRAHLVAAVLVFLVALSRLYLGVHFPHDVLGGLALGYFVLFLFVWVSLVAERSWLTWPRALRYGLALAVPVLLLAVWPLEDTAGSLGALAGFGMGGLIEVERVRFEVTGTSLQRLLRLLVGLVGVAVLYFGLRAALPDGIPWRFVRYASVGLFASVAAPWIFVRLGLAQAEPAPGLRLAQGSQ